MSRRSMASILAGVLLVALFVVALLKPVGYVIFEPGPTFDVLAKGSDQAPGKEIIDVSGHKVYRDNGQLRLVTIIPSQPDDKVSLMEAMKAWISRDDAVYPYDAVYAKADTADTVREQSAQQMTSSQDNAVAAALHALGIKFRTAVTVALVDKKGPSEGKLKTNDRILKVNGAPMATSAQLIKTVQAVKPGSQVTLEVRRTNALRTVEVTTQPSAADKTKSALKVSIAPGYDFPFHVALRLSDNIGGPSAGLMFSLGIYDVLTPGSLTNGKVIAGTGEITADGKVGEIGGIQQKLVGAQKAGARLFLVPAGNCSEALGGHYDSKKLRLVKASTLDEAIKDVKAWVKDPQAKLTRCTK
jgi:Lon-like protease